MRHRQRHSKDHNLLSKTKLTSQHLLHSDKSTYFSKEFKLSSLAQAKFNTIPLVGCSIALLGLGCILLNPTVNDNNANQAYALEDNSTIDDANADDGIMPLNTTADGVSLTINTPLPEDDMITKLVDSNGTNYITVDFVVGANNIDEYNVYVQADSTNLVGRAQGDIIHSIGNNTLGSEINSKQWGVSVVKGTGQDPATLTYSTIQTNVNTPADTVTAATGTKLIGISQAYTLAFAANLTSAKADHYQSDILLSVAMGADEVTQFLGFEDITFLQDMTEPICYHAEVGETKRLRDVRDKGKAQQNAYWVTKLADGNCWMTEDLRYQSGTATDIENWDNTYDTERYFQLGLYVIDDPLSMDICQGEKHLSTKQDILDKCVGHGITDVSSMIASDDPNFYYNHNNQVIEGNEYDAHFLIGNYYNFTAATKSSLADKTDEYTTISICPHFEGWRLPLIQSWGSSGSTTKLYNSYSHLGTSNLRLAPLYFILSGWIDPSIRYDDNGLNNLGSIGTRWANLSENGVDLGYEYGLSAQTGNLLWYNHTRVVRSEGLTARCVFAPSFDNTGGRYI